MTEEKRSVIAAGVPDDTAEGGGVQGGGLKGRESLSESASLMHCSTCLLHTKYMLHTSDPRGHQA